MKRCRHSGYEGAEDATNCDGCGAPFGINWAMRTLAIFAILITLFALLFVVISELDNRLP
jgi:hypothetical protein